MVGSAAVVSSHIIRRTVQHYHPCVDGHYHGNHRDMGTDSVAWYCWYKRQHAKDKLTP